MPPKGWFETRMTGPSFGMFARSASSSSTCRFIPLRMAALKSGSSPLRWRARASVTMRSSLGKPTACSTRKRETGLRKPRGAAAGLILKTLSFFMGAAF